MRKYTYSTNNVGHIFSKRLKKVDIENIVRKNEMIGILHNKDKGVLDWMTNTGKKELPEINFFFCAKHENSGKIESHLWFFKGFCSYVKPKYCQMIDIGTIPLKDSISKIVIRMEG